MLIVQIHKHVEQNQYEIIVSADICIDTNGVGDSSRPVTAKKQHLWDCETKSRGDAMRDMRGARNDD